MDKKPAVPAPASTSERYFFQVLKTGEKPVWPRPEEDLIVGQATLPGDLVQYWAYPKDLGKEADELPPAEVLASENPTPKPAILVDQPRVPVSDDEAVLELVLVKDNHALSKTSSSVSNLESNISALLEEAGTKFNIEVGHFMTTDRVSEDVEKKLDSLEEKEGVGEAASTPVPPLVPESSPELNDQPPPSPPPPLRSDFAPPPGPVPIEIAPSLPIRPVQSQIPSSGIYASTRTSRSSDMGSNLKWVVLLLIILGIGAGAFFFRDQVLSGVKSLTGGGTEPSSSSESPTPMPSETPTPTPDVTRADFQVRVLNGTTTTGAASALGDELKALGWGIDRVGNNSDQEVKQGYVKSKEELAEDVTNVLLSDLGEGFEATSSALPESDKADLEVVIGGE